MVERERPHQRGQDRLVAGPVVGGLAAPRPGGGERRGENPVVRFRQRGEFVLGIVLEAGSRRLQKQQILHARLHPRLVRVGRDPHRWPRARRVREAVRMRRAVDFETITDAFPGLDRNAAHLRVLFQEMPCQRHGEPLGLLAEQVFRQHVHGVLHRVGEDHPGVVARGVRRVEVAAQPHGHFEFLERVRRAIAQDLEHAHARFAVLMVDQFCAHGFLFAGCPARL